MTLKRLTSNTVANNLGILLLGLITSVLISHWIGPIGRGELAAAMLWPMLLVYIASMGIMSSSLYFAAQPDADPAKVTGNAIILGLIQTCVAIPAGYLLLPHLLHSQSATIIQESRVYLLVIPASLLTQFLLNILQGQLLLTVVNRLRLLNPVTYLVACIMLRVHGQISVWSLLFANLALNYLILFLTAVAFVMLRHKVNPGLDRSLCGKMLKFGLQVQIGDIAGAANLRLDQTLIAGWLPPAQLGLYVAAVSAVNVGQLLSTSVRTTATPTVAGKSSHEEKLKSLAKIFRMYWVLSIFSNVLLAAVLPCLLPLVFGNAFRASIPAAEVLLIGTFFYGARDVLSGGAQALGRPWIGSRGDVIASVVTVAALWLLLPRLGIMGAAIASVLAYGTELSVIVFLLGRTDGLRVRSLLYVHSGEIKRTFGELRSFLPCRLQPKTRAA